MSQWPESLSGLIAQGNPSILITIVEAKGSVPRGVGTKMIVTENGIHHGTIGGGNLEYQCIAMAQKRLSLDLIADNKQTGFESTKDLESNDRWSRMTHRFPLGASLGQCCGGLVIVLFEYIEAVETSWLTKLLKHKADRVKAELITPLKDPQEAKDVNINPLFHLEGAEPKQESDYLIEIVEASDFNIVVFGAGHVGRALIQVLSGVECEVTWVDSRANEFPESIPDNVKKVVDSNPEDFVETARSGSFFIVLTHNHSLDQLLCETILKHNNYRFCGLIGSQSKRKKFEHRMLKKGFSEQQLVGLTCPIGIRSMSGKQPGHIAVAVAAQLLELQESALN